MWRWKKAGFEDAGLEDESGGHKLGNAGSHQAWKDQGPLPRQAPWKERRFQHLEFSSLMMTLDSGFQNWEGIDFCGFELPSF